MSSAANYILLDAARMEDAIDKALEFNKSGQSLYNGKNEKVLASVSPYLFSYENDSEFAKWLAINGWGNSWGVYVLCFNDFDVLHKHFRKFILVKTEDGEELYFRFYDPRVLRVFLPTCDEDQLKEFFGPIKAFLMEDDDPAFGLIFSIGSTKELVTRKILKEEFNKVLAQGIGVLEVKPIIGKEKTTPSDSKKNKPPENKGRFSIFD